MRIKRAFQQDVFHIERFLDKDIVHLSQERVLTSDSGRSNRYFTYHHASNGTLFQLMPFDVNWSPLLQ